MLAQARVAAPPVAVATRSEPAVRETPAPVTLQAQPQPARDVRAPATHDVPVAVPAGPPAAPPVAAQPPRSAPTPIAAPPARSVATVDSAPRRVPAQETTAREPVREPPRAAEQTPRQQPADEASHQTFRVPRIPFLGVALLGSVRPYSVSGSGTRVLHVSGDPLVTISAAGWGLYFAPEMGSGAGHRSTMLGGGVMRQIIDLRFLRITALAGATTYSEEPDGLYAASFTSRSLKAGSVGGLASLSFIGPTRLAYRFQFIRGLADQADFHQRRHAVGLLF
jgi:hypothetical protein